MFALVTVAVAEPQWYGYTQAMDDTHMKTASGDTVSVATKKAEHHQLKASEYANNGYAYGYVKPTVVAATPVATTYASPVVNYANTYAAGMPLIHHLGKREAEADSQYIHNSGVNTNGYALPYLYNTVASPVPYNGVHNGVYNGVYNGLYNTYSGLHSIGKREAEADSQWIYNAGVYANGYNGYALPKFYNGVYNTAIASPVVSYNGAYTNGLYNTYGAGVHAIGKREAEGEADSQWVYNAGVYANGYNGYSIPKVFNGAYNTAIASPVVSYNGIYTNGLYNTYGAGVHAIGKREAEAESQWVYNNGYTPLTGYTGYTGLAGYTTPYAYGNVWNRAQYLW